MGGSCLLVIAAIVSLYAFQPDAKRLEINRLANVYVHGGSHIGFVQILRDVWSVYSSKGLVPCDVRPDDSPVFGGIPRCKAPLTVLKNDAYWIGYSEEKRSPLWAAYRLTDVTFDEKPAARAESFLPDRRTTAQVTSDQYTNSGYDRGHLASSYSIAKCYGVTAQMQTLLHREMLWRNRADADVLDVQRRSATARLQRGNLEIFGDEGDQHLCSTLPVHLDYYRAHLSGRHHPQLAVGHSRAGGLLQDYLG